MFRDWIPPYSWSYQISDTDPIRSIHDTGKYKNYLLIIKTFLLSVAYTNTDSIPSMGYFTILLYSDHQIKTSGNLSNTKYEIKLLLAHLELVFLVYMDKDAMLYSHMLTWSQFILWYVAMRWNGWSKCCQYCIFGSSAITLTPYLSSKNR